MPLFEQESVSYLPLPQPLPFSSIENLNPELKSSIGKIFKFLNKGEDAFESLSYSDAKRYFLSSISLSEEINLAPLSAEAHYYLGFCYAKQEDFKQAINEITQARRFFLRYSLPYNALICSINLSGFYIRAKDFEQFKKASQDCIEDAIIMAPDQIPKVIDLYAQFVVEALRQEDPAIIISMLRTFSNIDQYYRKIGTTFGLEFPEFDKDRICSYLDGLIEVTRVFSNIDHYYRIIEAILGLEFPKSDSDYTNLSLLKESIPKIQNAIGLCEQGVSLALNSQFREATRKLTHSLDWAKLSLIKLETLIVLIHHARGRVYFHVGKFRHALRDYKKALKIKPDHTLILVDMASTLLELRHYKKALKTVGTALKINDQDVNAHLIHGRILVALKQDGEALDSYSVALEISPGHTAVHYYRMLTHIANYRWILAARDLCALLAVNADELANCSGEMMITVLRNAVDECFKMAPKSEELQQFLEELQKLTPDSHKLLAARAWFHLIHNRCDDALRDLTAAIEKDNHQCHYFFIRGQVYEALNELRNAVQDYTRAVELDPGNKEFKEKLHAAQTRLHT